MNIEWKEPPTPTNRKWAPIIAQLKANPGSWALIGTMSISTAYTYSKRYGVELRLGAKDKNRAEVYFRAPEVA